MRSAFLLIAAIAAAHASAMTPHHRRALLIGINDYSASTLKAPAGRTPVPNRDWPDLGGAANDVALMREALIARCGFRESDIATLIDQKATRDSILASIRARLVEPASKGDVVFFYFAGHGSQVRNSRSDEPDKLDESIVPADSRVGAPDIHDKELRRLFNSILDRGARLTVMIDACHSGSAARGLLTGARVRGVAPDLRDVADGPPFGPRPENRGALVLSASHDFDSAWETHDEQRHPHGAFTWAWMRSLREATAGEPAMETFLRAQARLRGERPFQDPVCAGNDRARTDPFLGVANDRNALRPVVAVQRVRRDGMIVVEGGWINGLSVGSELRVADSATGVRVLIVKEGFTRSEARLKPAVSTLPASIAPGALLELSGWSAPPPAQLFVHLPRTRATAAQLRSFAEAVASKAEKHRMRWISDPVTATPDHLLRQIDGTWELLDRSGKRERFGSEGATLAAIGRLPRGAALFLQLPVPADLAEQIEIDSATIVAVPRPENAHYVLAGRYRGRAIEYAWVRPAVSRNDRRKSGLPLRSVWLTVSGGESVRDAAVALTERARRLRKIVAWSQLESPRGEEPAYGLEIRRLSDGQLAGDALEGNETYALALRSATSPPPPRVPKRYVYVFTIDSYGQSTLLFPQSGSIENRFPMSGAAEDIFAENPPPEIPLGPTGQFEVTAPYGVDTYFLLTTDEPLVNPWILQWDGVRGQPPNTATALERLLAQTSSGRAARITTPADWSIRRVVYESIAPRRRRTPQKRRHGVYRSRPSRE